MKNNKYFKPVTISLVILALLIASTFIFYPSKGKFVEALHNPAEGDKLDEQGCFIDYKSWPSSFVLKLDAPWSNFRMWENNNTAPLSKYLDINGDGLLDYMYTQFNAVNSHYAGASCVMLNNGSGWDLVYKCKGNYDSAANKTTFYGDCAQP